MTPQAFIAKWADSELKERSASQSHFNDLCALLGEQNPTDADQAGEWFCFEKGAKMTGGGDGWADVYFGRGWSMGKGNDPRYNSSVAFEIFQFPKGFDFPLRNSASLAVPQGSLSCVNTIHLLKDFDFDSIAQAAKRLDNIHKELDTAVTTAYGWDVYTSAKPDEEILARLFKLNQKGVSK